jgi:universal stress protein E
MQGCKLRSEQLDQQTMKTVRNILVIVDPTRREQPAIAKAARLARPHGARVTLFACDTPSSREARWLNTHVESGAAPLPLDLQALLDSFSAPLRADGLKVAVECTSAQHLHTAILQRACATDIDLLLKDTHHHSLAHRTFMTNTDWHLIRECTVPVLFTKATPWKSSPTILAALDPLHVNDKPALLDRDILDWGVTLRSTLTSELHGVHAFIPLAVATASTGTVGAVAITAEMIADEESRRRDQLRKLMADCDVPDQNVHLQFGSATEVIPHTAARLQADIVVMGAVSRSNVGSLFIGHTAERVLDRLASDVLVVRRSDAAAMPP